MKPRPLWLFLAVLSAATFAAAQPHPNVGDAFETLAGAHAQLQLRRDALSAGQTVVRSGRPTRENNEALSRVLSTLPSEVDAYAALLGAEGPAQSLATQADQAAGHAERLQAAYLQDASAGAAPFAEGLAQLKTHLERLLAEGERRHPTLASRAHQIRSDPRRRAALEQDHAGGLRGVLDCPEGFDNGRCRGRGVNGTQTNAVYAGAVTTHQLPANTVNGAQNLASGGYARLDGHDIPGEDNSRPLSPASLACMAAVGDHPTIAQMCRNHPNLAPLIAGLLDALKQQFGTLTGILMNIFFFIFGLLSAVVTGGVGLILKLIGLIGMGWGIWMALKGIVGGVRQYLGHPEGTVERAAGLRQVGVAGGGLLIMVMMALAGFGLGKTRMGKAAFGRMEGGMRGALTRTGMTRPDGTGIIDGANAALAPVMSWLSRLLPGERPPVSSGPPQRQGGVETTTEPRAVEPEPQPEPQPVVPPKPPTALELAKTTSGLSSTELTAASRSPTFFRRMAQQALKNDPLPPKAVEARAQYQRGNPAGMTAIKNLFIAQARGLARQLGIPDNQVIVTGTNLRGLVGMTVEGQMVATTRYAGHESADLWGTSRIETGSGYAAQAVVNGGKPGVLLLMREANGLKVVAGETLSRPPTIADDVLGAVVSDGENTFVLSREALRALRGSAEAWKGEAVRQIKAGDGRAFHEWEQTRDRLVPRG